MRQRQIAGLALFAAVAAVSGCAHPDDFGVATRQNIASQIADPDARYRRDLPPGSSGARTALSQDRYAKGQVTPLSATGASDVGTAAGASEAAGSKAGGK